MTTLTIRRLDAKPAFDIVDAELIALGYFLLDPAAGPHGIDVVAGHEPTDRITRKDLERINRTFVARSRVSAWTGFIGRDGEGHHLEWLAALRAEWDLIAMDDATWEAAGVRDAVARALREVDRDYIRRAVGTKMLHLKRPALIPVLDSFVVRQLGEPTDADIAGTMVLIDHIRAEGRANLEALRAIRSFLDAPHPGLDARHLERTAGRSLVRILDAILWSRDKESWLANLPALVEMARGHGPGGATIA